MRPAVHTELISTSAKHFNKRTFFEIQKKRKMLIEILLGSIASIALCVAVILVIQCLLSRVKQALSHKSAVATTTEAISPANEAMRSQQNQLNDPPPSYQTMFPEVYIIQIEHFDENSKDLHLNLDYYGDDQQELPTYDEIMKQLQLNATQ